MQNVWDLKIITLEFKLKFVLHVPNYHTNTLRTIQNVLKIVLW